MLSFNKYLAIIFILVVIVDTISNLYSYNNFNNKHNKVLCIINCAKQVILFVQKLIFFNIL